MIASKLLDKSKEAFVMAIEIYNKPSIRYRVEGFSFFICNAWELMLKSHMLKSFGNESIYHKDNPSRTLSLENCVRKVFTNEKAPLRKNLEKIIDLRNTSTHFITEEYEMVYIPLFQACVFNFIEKMQDFHNFDMTLIIPQNFLTLTISMNALNDNEVRAKYPEQISERLIATRDTLSPLIDENNQYFAIRVDHHHYLTKDKNKATEILHIDKNADTGVQIIKDLKDPNDTHKYSATACAREIRQRLKRANIQLKKEGKEVLFNTTHFTSFCKYFDMKLNPRFCYVYRVHSQPSYSYSIQAIEFIVDEIKKDPENIIQNLKENKKS